VPDFVQGTKIVARLLEPLVNSSQTLGWEIATFHHICVVYLQPKESMSQAHTIQMANIPWRTCAVYSLWKKREEMIYWWPDCKVGLCIQSCFKLFHTHTDLLIFWQLKL
jgi:hypothetical protein